MSRKYKPTAEEIKEATGVWAKRRLAARAANADELTYDAFNQRRLRRAVTRGQFKRCMICDSPGKAAHRAPLYVDHDHKTNRIRGILCPRCNAAIALLDNGLLARTLAYLRKSDTARKKALRSL